MSKKPSRKKLLRALRLLEAHISAPPEPPVYRVAAILDGDGHDARIEKVIVERDGRAEVRVERRSGRHWVVYLIDEFGNEIPVDARVMPNDPYPTVFVDAPS